MKARVKTLTGVVMFLVMMLAVSIPASAQKFTGKVGGKYPVVVYLDPNGTSITGKYAYRSTLKKQGDKPSTWLYIKGTAEDMGARGTTYNCVVRDSKGKMVEHWSLDYYSWGVEATITTSSGKVYHLTLN